MRKTNKIILISVMISLLLLGIGYAAIQNITLSISGVAEVNSEQANFNVRFVEPITIENNGYDNIEIDAHIENDVNATINLGGDINVNEPVSVTYTIRNESADLSADLTVTASNDNPEYFTITSKLDETSIKVNEETTVTVTVELTKIPIFNDESTNILVELIAMPVQPGEEGTSGGIKDFDQNPRPMGLNEFGYYYDRLYINEEVGEGFISHADFSAEWFLLEKAENNSQLEKDEWFCSNYWEPGGTDPLDEIIRGARVEEEGNVIYLNGIRFDMADVIPHGIYKNNSYYAIDSDGNEVEMMYRDDGIFEKRIYNEDGSIKEENIWGGSIFLSKNGYMLKNLGDKVGKFNATGDLFYTYNDGIIYKVREIHNYSSEIINNATCTEDGQVKYICRECGQSYTTVLMAHHHKNDQDLNGICDDCNEEIEYGKIVYAVDDFAWCTGVEYRKDHTEIIVPKYIYLEMANGWGKFVELQEWAFEWCYNLKTVQIPDSITLIGRNAFYECYDLETINYEGTQEQWEQIVIQEGNERLNDVTINFNYGK